ncbi:MAG: phage minor head protein [Methanobrevibacter sp.]|uniref:phage minor head protein n=1 Tax=Methanobrevibacter sp. TaxID=66852 RepID=UPI003F0B8B97
MRRSIKNQIFQGVIQGENPHKLAPKISNLGLETLPNSTLSPRQRAVMIAKTEVSRAQNTGMLQSYVNEGYTEVKILTAEDDNVCHICLKNAYEFNDDAEIIYSNHGKERVHNVLNNSVENIQ